MHASMLLQLVNPAQCDADEQAPSRVVAQAQEYEAQAQGHAQAQSQLFVHAHNLTAKAHAHATAQVRLGLPFAAKVVCTISLWVLTSAKPFLQVQAEAQAQQAAEEACHFDATAQRLQAEANLMATQHMEASSQQAHNQAEHHATHQLMQPYHLSDTYRPPGSPVAPPPLNGGEGLVPSLPALEFGGRHTGHHSSSPGTALLESALISMPDAGPDAELDDGQLILAAAEVHFEDHAALRSHSVPCSKTLPSAIKRSASHHNTTAEQRQDTFPAMHRVASCHASAMTAARAPPLKVEQEPCPMESLAEKHLEYLHSAPS